MMQLPPDIDRLELEIDLLYKVAKENFWIGFVLGIMLGSIITWACVA